MNPTGCFNHKARGYTRLFLRLSRPHAYKPISPNPVKIALFHTSGIADRHQIKVENIFYAHVSLPPRPVSYSGFAASVLSNRKSKSGRFGKSEETVAQSQSQPQCGCRNQCRACGKRDSEETVQEGSNCGCLPSNDARCSGRAIANREGRGAWFISQKDCKPDSSTGCEPTERSSHQSGDSRKWPSLG